MTLFPDHDLEERLRACAQRQAMPDGLAGRVYRASVAFLPEARALPLKLVTVRRVGAWGRLAMAASIALACAAGLRLLSADGQAPLSPDLEMALLEYAGRGLAGPVDAQLTAVERLLVTRTMTYRDIEGDVASLARDLDM
jgi:hypothetical protein